MSAKWIFTVEGDYYEDQDELKTQTEASNNAMKIGDVLDEIRSRLKYGEDVSDQEEKTLERIREILLKND